MPRLTIEQYAALRAELDQHGEDNPATLARFGIPSSAAHLQLKLEFALYFQSDTKALERFVAARRALAARQRQPAWKCKVNDSNLRAWTPSDSSPAPMSESPEVEALITNLITHLEVIVERIALQAVQDVFEAKRRAAVKDRRDERRALRRARRAAGWYAQPAFGGAKPKLARPKTVRKPPPVIRGPQVEPSLRTATAGLIPVPESQSDADDNPSRNERCLICRLGFSEKALQQASWVEITTDRQLIPAGHDVSGTEKSQGLFPVGSECARKIPFEYRRRT